MARQARPSDLGQSIAPSINGDGQTPLTDIGPQVAEPRVSSPFPPIAEYAFLSDCEVNCLIAPTGRVEWMCLPRPDSPSVFAAILDRGAGSFSFGPTAIQVPAGRRYLPGTLVLETTWRTRTGWLIVRDAMCIGPWYHSARRSGTYAGLPACLRLRPDRGEVGVRGHGLQRGDRERRRGRGADQARDRPSCRLRGARRARDEDLAPGRAGLRRDGLDALTALDRQGVLG